MMELCAPGLFAQVRARLVQYPYLVLHISEPISAHLRVVAKARRLADARRLYAFHALDGYASHHRLSRKELRSLTELVEFLADEAVRTVGRQAWRVASVRLKERSGGDARLPQGARLGG